MIDTANKFQVRGIAAGRRPMPTTPGIMIAGRLPALLSFDDAINLAIWLVALADPERQRFEEAWRELRPDPKPRNGT